MSRYNPYAFEYQDFRRVLYGDFCASFIPVCPKCRRFVKADPFITFTRDGDFDEKLPNATCHKCGRVAMPFEGYVYESA